MYTESQNVPISLKDVFPFVTENDNEELKIGQYYLFYSDTGNVALGKYADSYVNADFIPMESLPEDIQTKVLQVSTYLKTQRVIDKLAQ